MEYFSLKPVLAVTLITVGTGMLIWSWGALAVIPDPYRHATLWLAGAMLIGTGVMIPFKRPQLGAIVGGLLFLLMLLVLLIGTAIYDALVD